MDASPVGHWTQALARALQGGLGGYQMSQADAADAKLTRQRELEAATEKAKAEAEKRNTPDYQWISGEGMFNMNPYMAGANGPLQVSRATQKRDELTAYQRAQLERQQKLDDWRMKKETADEQAEPAFKENQVRVGEFARRIALGNDEVDAALAAGADPTASWYQGNLTSDDSRWNSKEWKQYKQAKDAIILAILRKDTGATITDREYDETDRTYFPQPGDTPEIVEQKARARKQLQADLAASSGGAFDYMEKRNPRPPRANGPTSRISSQAEYDALPSGSEYIAPDGSKRTKR